MTNRPDAEALAPLTPLLAAAQPSWDELRERYGALLKLVDTVLGVVPTCDRYLEIWPPGFRTYNVLVPNFLNLPAPILGVGKAPPAAIGLAMYVASRTAQCAYCSAHSCSFAMRRGASPAKVAAALLPGHAEFTRGELATIAVARSLARVPCELTSAERDELLEVYGARGAEWIVLAVAMMGFLNKFMDAIGVELEQTVFAEVSTTIGPDWTPGKAGALLDQAAPTGPPPPADGWRTRLRMLPLLPAVVRYDKQAQRGVPKGWPEAGRFLRERTGHDFPALANLHSGRARGTMATMLRDNLDPALSVVGLEVKVLAAAVFAEIVGNATLATDVRALAAHHGVTPEQLDAAVTFGAEQGGAAPAAGPEGALLSLARAASPSPAQVNGATIAECRSAGLSPAAIVELVTWLSVLQAHHRLSSFTEGVSPR